MNPSDLHIPVSQIPGAGYFVDGELPISWIAEALLPAYTATTTLSVRLEAKRVNDNVMVRGDGEVTLAFECGRTLKKATIVLEISMSELFTPAFNDAFNLGDGIEVDETMGDEPFTIRDGAVDLEALVREHLVLAQEPYPTVEGPANETNDDVSDGSPPMWTSDQADGDPRWAALKTIKLD
ncbi:MAG: uncharacterized metal-binding protein YceD (DUF177 family) [Myxococcota bacterium]|jgi:uncharacterized metal-binding protein YceD (DUF177 family)